MYLALPQLNKFRFKPGTNNRRTVLLEVRKNYELIEHTADIGVRVRGADLKFLFENAACAMFDIITKGQKPVGGTKKKIAVKQEGQGREELFINWLNELLSLSSAKGLIFTGFKIRKLDAGSLEADVSGRDIAGYKGTKEIKAATYHQLKIEEQESGWVAEVILDV